MKVNQLIEKLTHNWPQKLVCFVFALFLYLFYHMSLVDKKTIVLPLHVYSDGGVVSTGNIPSSVKVVVRANQNDIGAIHNSDLVASINLNYLNESGTYKLPVNLKISDNVMAFDPLEIKITPEMLDVTVEEKVTVPVALETVFFGEIAHGYEIVDVDVTPPFVDVTGPRSQVEKLQSFKTGTIDISDVNKTFSRKTAVLNNNKLLSIAGGNEIVVTATVDAKKMKKSLEGIKIIPTKLQSDLLIETEIPLLSLVIEGNVLTVEDFKLEAVNVSFDGITDEGVYYLPIYVNLPRNVKILERSLDTLEVHLKKVIIDSVESSSGEMSVSDSGIQIS